MGKTEKLVLGVLFAAGALAACGDDPLAENEDADYFLLNPSFAVVAVDGQTTINAVVVNGNGVATGDAVSAEPCNARITAEVDPGRSAFEPPERFIVHGVTIGESCLVVRGGGLTDTATVSVVAAP